MRKTPVATIVAGLLVLLLDVALDAERLGYPPEEFTARRQALSARLGEGLVVMFGKTMPALGVRSRQDNDFFYLTGNEDLNAVLVMEAATAGPHLFLPKQNASEIRSDGPNWLESPDMAKALQDGGRGGLRRIARLSPISGQYALPEACSLEPVADLF